MKGQCFYWIATFAVSLLLALPAPARADLTWDTDAVTGGAQDGGGTWIDSGTNWWNGTTTVAWSNASPTVAIFGVDSAGTVEVDATGVTATGLKFVTGYTLSGPLLGGSSTVTLVSGGTDPPQIWADYGKDPTILATLAGTDIDMDGGWVAPNPEEPLVGTGGGGIILGAANAWTGNLRMINPQFTHNPSFCATVTDALAPAGTVSVNGGAFIAFSPPNAATAATDMSFSTAINVGGHGAGDANPQRVRGALCVASNVGGYLPGVVTLSGPVTLTEDATTFCTSNGTPKAGEPTPKLVISGSIGETSGSAKSLYFSGVGILELQGANTFTGDLVYYRSASLNLNSSSGGAVPGNLVFRSSLYASGVVNVMQNEQIANGGIIDFAYTGTSLTQTVNLIDVTETVKGIQMANANEARGVIQNGGTAAATLVLDTAGGNYSYTGKLQNGSTGGTLALTKKGLGSQTLSGTCTLGGGTVIQGGSLVVNSASFTSNVDVQSGSLGGSGTVTGTVTTHGGNVAPGASAGILTMSNLDASAGGGMTWELGALKDDVGGGVAGTDYDLAVVSTSLTLGGTSQLTLDFGLLAEEDRPGYGTPDTFWASDHSWKIIDVGDTGSTTGDFTTLVNGSFVGVGTFDTRVAGNDVFLDFDSTYSPLPPIPGDTNNNRIIDETDAAVVAGNWGANVGTGGYASGDFNNDHVVNALDAAIQVANWGSHVAESAAVPEPGALTLLLAGVIGAALWKRRGRQQ